MPEPTCRPTRRMPLDRADADTKRLLRSIEHPLRGQIIRTLGPDRIMSPRQLADAIDEPLANVSYHVRKLAERDAGVLELVHTRPRRGAVEHFYRLRLRVHIELTVETLPPRSPEQILAAIAREDASDPAQPA